MSLCLHIGSKKDTDDWGSFCYCIISLFFSVIDDADSWKGTERCIPIYHVRIWCFSGQSMAIIVEGTGMLCIVV